MARLFGLIGNRAELGGRVLAYEAEALRARAHGTPLGWGVGFYQGGEVLMRRRPIDENGEVDIAKLAGDVKADLVIGHVRAATIGAPRVENTHPFRYRQWMFAQTGTLPRFDAVRERLVASIPEFLRTGIRGETDAEVVFHVFLSFLHDAGRLNDEVVEAPIVREALKSTLSVVDGTLAEVGGEPASLNALVTNGISLVAVRRAEPMAYRVFHGKEDAEAIMGDDVHLRGRTAAIARMDFILLASDFDGAPPPRWKPVADRAIVTLARGEDLQIESA